MFLYGNTMGINCCMGIEKEKNGGDFYENIHI
jgi:hypothetical protein